MDYYHILGLPRTAGHQQIKAAYRRLALQYHPDRNPAPAAEEIFKKVSDAYSVLSDQEQRSIYDRAGCNPGAAVCAAGVQRFDAHTLFQQLFGPALPRYEHSFDMFWDCGAVPRPQTCTLTGLHQHTDLNGRTGQIVRFDDDRQRYTVSIGRKYVSIQPNNVILHQGTVVRLRGLRQASQLNGQRGRVVAFENSTRHYVLNLLDLHTPIQVHQQHVRV